MTSRIITADLHFDSDPLTDYRWGIYYALEKQIYANNVKEVYILGDITEKKDNHGSALVNKVVDFFTKLSSLCKVTILKGNHDYIDEKTPFFGFLNEMPNIHFISEPTLIDDKFFIPHTRGDFPEIPENIDEVYMHQTFRGALANNGVAHLRGIDMPESLLNSKAKFVFSGDIHKNQFLRKVRYVGAPYHINFGDKYTPSMVLCYNNDVFSRINTKFLYTDDLFPQRVHWTIDAENIGSFNVITDVDYQAKVTLLVSDFTSKSFAEEKETVRKLFDLNNITLVSIDVLRKDVSSLKDVTKADYLESPEDSFIRYSLSEKIDTFTYNLGIDILNENKNT